MTAKLIRFWATELITTSPQKTALVTITTCTPPPPPPPQDSGGELRWRTFGVFKMDMKSYGSQLTTKLDWRQISLEEWLEDLIHLTV